MQRRTFVAACGALTVSPMLVRAQAWPAKSIRFIVPYIPGSAPDVLARTSIGLTVSAPQAATNVLRCMLSLFVSGCQTSD